MGWSRAFAVGLRYQLTSMGRMNQPFALEICMGMARIQTSHTWKKIFAHSVRLEDTVVKCWWLCRWCHSTQQEVGLNCYWYGGMALMLMHGPSRVYCVSGNVLRTSGEFARVKVTLRMASLRNRMVVFLVYPGLPASSHWSTNNSSSTATPL